MAPSWLAVLDDTISACTAHSRPDLAHRLQRRRARLLDPRLRVLVVGLLNQGKSQLINALLNAPVCAVGDDLTTTAPTVVQHAESPAAALVTDSGARNGNPAIAGPAERVAVPIDEVTRQVSRRAEPNMAGRVVRAEIGIPRKLLADGLVLIDTPAISGETSTLGRMLAGADQADAVVFASAATAELSTVELELLTRLAATCPNIIVALTKIDLVPRWRQVAERNLARLASQRVAATLIPCSATLRLAAAKHGDTTINAESGFPELVNCLQHQVAAKSDEIAPRTVGVVCGAAIGELADGLKTALSAPLATRTPDAETQLELAQRAMDELRRHTGRCQTVLGDQVADLASDVEHDLRERTRRILREVDRVFDDADPRVVWESFEQWLRDSLTDAAEANLGWLVQRCQWVADRVIASFPNDVADAPADALLERMADPAEHVGDLDEPRLDPFSAGQKIFTGLRGSYGGVLMFGLITSLAGLPLINPISLGAGAAFGGKSIKDESEARLKRRQGTAKATAQRHVDDFFLACGKESKDLTRQVQRILRDHITERAEDLAERIAAGSRLARQTAQAAAVEREQHRQRVATQLRSLVDLHRRAMTMAGQRLGGTPSSLELSA
ncbi:MAG TPA: dynamin family protein [Pseudonocardiaceae bacterium]|jgi:GTP-binding protein EngB required for normal cell division|nr:dynamin family protein [Pseudonocardiaceae bacterium]